MDAGVIPEYPRKAQSAVAGALPWDWCGTAAVDGTTGLWLEAPLGSRYTRITAASVSLRIKTTATGANGDWLTATLS